ncbi:class I SAM-dependent methyltransferase [Bradyrhizobium sp. 26S5]|uniref:class I SAM-dependent methyltransferase n=1 Tax=Bradyrhizobium sp. 26S5 TaxID=3139729 RepID=UPI0030CEE0D7
MVWAVDLSPEMCAYAQDRAMRQGVDISTSVSDIRQFRLRTRFDLAILMLDSGSHLLTSEDMDRHLENVAFHVRRGGLYILEFAYPSSPKSQSKTQERWKIHGRGVDLSVAWRSTRRSAVAPPRYLSQVEISGTLRSRKVVVFEEMLLRSWSKRAIQNAVSRTQAFEVAAVLGDFSEQSVFDRSSWRMIFVLRRIGDYRRRRTNQ